MPRVHDSQFHHTFVYTLQDVPFAPPSSIEYGKGRNESWIFFVIVVLLFVIVVLLFLFQIPLAGSGRTQQQASWAANELAAH